MTDFLEALSRAPDLLAQHLLLAMAALALGLLLSLPLAIWSARVPMVGRVALGFASLVQTIPSLALLAYSTRCCCRSRPWSAAAFRRSGSCRRCSR